MMDEKKTDLPLQGQEPQRKEKPKNERVREAVALLQQLRNVGINDQSPGYAELKGHVNEWIYDNVGWTGTIVFPRFTRKAHVVLPVLPGRYASIHLTTIT